MYIKPFKFKGLLINGGNGFNNISCIFSVSTLSCFENGALQKKNTHTQQIIFINNFVFQFFFFFIKNCVYL